MNSLLQNRAWACADKARLTSVASVSPSFSTSQNGKCSVCSSLCRNSSCQLELKKDTFFYQTSTAINWNRNPAHTWAFFVLAHETPKHNSKLYCSTYNRSSAGPSCIFVNVFLPTWKFACAWVDLFAWELKKCVTHFCSECLNVIYLYIISS